MLDWIAEWINKWVNGCPINRLIDYGITQGGPTLHISQSDPDFSSVGRIHTRDPIGWSTLSLKEWALRGSHFSIGHYEGSFSLTTSNIVSCWQTGKKFVFHYVNSEIVYPGYWSVTSSYELGHLNYYLHTKSAIHLSTVKDQNCSPNFPIVQMTSTYKKNEHKQQPAMSSW